MTTSGDDGALLQIHHQQPSSEWLAASREEPLEPEMPVIDAHHHFSEHWGGYAPDDLLADGEGHNIVATTYVQCGWQYRASGPEALKPVGETEAVVSATRGINGRQHKSKIAAAIVGYADLRLGAAVDDVLAAHVIAGEGRFRGVRNSGAWHVDFKHGILARPMPRLYADAAFREGYARLGRHGMSFDAWVYHTQLEDVFDLAVAHPEVTLVLDHVGGLLGVSRYTGRPDLALAEWFPWMKRLARCPNVVVKIGGMGTAVFGFPFATRPHPPSSQELADAWAPLVRPTLELFGADRCLFESNFPVDRSAAGYGVVWNALKRLASGLSNEEKRLLFHGTAARVYRIAEKPQAEEEAATVPGTGVHPCHRG